MEHRSWNDTTAADVIFDIMKMREYIKSQQIFAMDLFDKIDKLEEIGE